MTKKQVFKSDKKDCINVVKICSVTHTQYCVTVEEEKYERYMNGISPIQFIFPDMSTDDREFLISGFTPDEWDKYFDSWPK